LAINDSFIDYFNLELKAGEFFKLKDYLDTTDLVPVVAGSNFENFFRLGDIIQSKKDGIQYNIIGFLKNGSKYYDIKSSSDIIPLDKALILPIQSNKAKIQNDFGLFDTIINKTVIITDNENMLRSIAEKSAELKLYTFDFKSVGEQMAYINEEMNQWTLSLLVFCMIILFFCIIGMICNTLQVLNELTRELGVHILCGATKRSILLRLFFQVSFLILLPNIFILLIYSVSAITMFTIFISIFLTIIVMIAPYMKVTNTSMNELLRRNE
ncbi:MAG: hypothetical protein GX239_09710, partial [Clostridiaceae bacterium]|nr:hypothetical protein [Clostridiaceae bacterium]